MAGSTAGDLQSARLPPLRQTSGSTGKGAKAAIGSGNHSLPADEVGKPAEPLGNHGGAPGLQPLAI
jgi:hypothetical protein